MQVDKLFTFRFESAIKISIFYMVTTNLDMYHSGKLALTFFVVKFGSIRLWSAGLLHFHIVIKTIHFENTHQNRAISSLMGVPWNTSWSIRRNISHLKMSEVLECDLQSAFMWWLIKTKVLNLFLLYTCLNLRIG